MRMLTESGPGLNCVPTMKFSTFSDTKNNIFAGEYTLYILHSITVKAKNTFAIMKQMTRQAETRICGVIYRCVIAQGN